MAVLDQPSTPHLFSLLCFSLLTFLCLLRLTLDDSLIVGHCFPTLMFSAFARIGMFCSPPLPPFGYRFSASFYCFQFGSKRSIDYVFPLHFYPSLTATTCLGNFIFSRCFVCLFVCFFFFCIGVTGVQSPSRMARLGTPHVPTHTPLFNTHGVVLFGFCFRFLASDGCTIFWPISGITPRMIP